MRHGDRKVFVGGENWLRHTGALLFGLGVGLDDRGKVGPRISEEVFDPALGKKTEIDCGNAVLLTGRHRVLLFALHALGRWFRLERHSVGARD